MHLANVCQERKPPCARDPQPGAPGFQVPASKDVGAVRPEAGRRRWPGAQLASGRRPFTPRSSAPAGPAPVEELVAVEDEEEQDGGVDVVHQEGCAHRERRARLECRAAFGCERAVFCKRLLCRDGMCKLRSAR